MSGINLSSQTKVLWGKLNEKNNEWLPLYVHLEDSGEVAKLLWDNWLPLHTKQIIAEGIDANANALKSSEESFAYAKKIITFIALAHDIGKASPLFQAKASMVGFCDIVDEIRSKGLAVNPNDNATTKSYTHAVVSECVLEQAGLDSSYGCIIGAHHGKPPLNKQIIESAGFYGNSTGIGDEKWGETHKELIELSLNIAGLKCLPKGKLSVMAQVILNGFLIMTDWIASGADFPLISRDFYGTAIKDSAERAKLAWNKLNLPQYSSFADSCSTEALFEKRFAIKKPRAMQSRVLADIAQADKPGIVVIEAPMGEGKTEAALAVAEILGNKYGLSGVYFALPTQATSDGIFKRIETWIKKLHNSGTKSIFLAHGKAGFNKDYEGIRIRSNICNYEDNSSAQWETQESVIVNDWTQGRKKGLLSDFVIGTVDQILMAGLKKKHLALRHLGIANKVVIIDECHAYDTYMSSYLSLVLNWLGAYRMPVIMLSATLPASRRQEMIKSYQANYGLMQEIFTKKVRRPLRRKKDVNEVVVTDNLTLNTDAAKFDYPVITYTDNNVIKTIVPEPSGRKQKIGLKQLASDDIIGKLEELLRDGGCAGVICNTVGKAQEVAGLLATKFDSSEVMLLHSRFIASDRVQNELDLREKLGPPSEVSEAKRPHKLIVVGTQVMEQSLDVDFDVMISDICPVDLLLQRMGRLHRHERKNKRPVLLQQPTCYVTGISSTTEFDSGSEAVYGKYLLMKTLAFWQDEVQIPDDIPYLVQRVYEKEYDNQAVKNLETMDGNFEETTFRKAEAESDTLIGIKKNKAKTFQISEPKEQGNSLIGWLNADLKDDQTGKKGEATVRDIDASLEVIVIVRKANSDFYTLPIGENTEEKILMPNEELAKKVAGCTVTLPMAVIQKYNIDEAIKELENVALENGLVEWYQSYWLNGELFLVLDENYETTLLGKKLKYDTKYGLMVQQNKKEE